MIDIYKKIKISWTYPTQPTSLQIGTVKIYRGTSEFTLDNVLSQVELVSQEYDPTFTSFTDDFELEYDVTYYYMIIVYGDIDSTISAATSLYSAKIESPEDTIPPNEVHFTTLAGIIDYMGEAGDQILLSDGTIVDVTVTYDTFTFNVPSGKHKVKLVESVGRSDYVLVGGEALVEINNFPTLSSVSAFAAYSSPNLVKVPTILPSNITSLNWMFQGATSFNQDISMWDTSNVKVMSVMFDGATAFNQPIGNWDTSNVTDMSYMFENASAFNQDLSQWCVTNITSLPYDFDDGATNWTLPRPVWGTCPRGEDSEDEIADALFTKVTYIQTDDSEPMTVAVQYKPENVNGKLHIDWGDGAKEVFTKESFIVADGQENVIVAAHPYTTNGEYVVKVYSTTNTFIVFPTITKLIDWGTAGNMQIKLSSANLIEVPTTLPSHITDTSIMFSDATSFNQDISMWDTSNVTNMSYMFINATSFNQPIGSWNVSNVTDMSTMFYGASLFNQPLNDWDTSNVTDMSTMFQYAVSFNQPLSNWNVSKVTDMLQMFLDATEFNQDLSRWCVALIISSPTGFTHGSALAMENYPVWGTCPNG